MLIANSERRNLQESVANNSYKFGLLHKQKKTRSKF